MQSHAIKLKISPKQADNTPEVPTPEPPDWVDVVPQRVREIVDKHTEVITQQSQETHHVQPTEESEDTRERMEGWHCFDWGDDPVQILDDLEAKLKDADWYELWRHTCRHEPGGKNEPCDDWTLERELK